MTALHAWFATPLGRYALACEQRYIDHAVADIFGYYAVQVGIPDVPFLRESRIPWKGVVGEQGNVAVGCVPFHLPFANQSLDLVLLPHVLDFSPQPHQVLREVERVLVPEGRAVLTGFNPYSLWGMARRLKNQQCPPWQGRFIALHRLKDWLRVLSLEPAGGAFLCYRPPFEGEAWLARCAFMEDAGDRWWPAAAGVYGLEVIKRVHGMRLLTPRWQTYAPRALAVPVGSKRDGRLIHTETPHDL